LCLGDGVALRAAEGDEVFEAFEFGGAGEDEVGDDFPEVADLGWV